MGRKPNYRWERQERDRIKAAKKAERRKAQEERAAGRRQEGSPDPADGDPEPDRDSD